jgi:hypothetical protein
VGEHEERKAFFSEEKEAKNFYVLPGPAGRKSLFGSFSSEKELLTSG